MLFDYTRLVAKYLTYDQFESVFGLEDHERLVIEARAESYQEAFGVGAEKAELLALSYFFSTTIEMQDPVGSAAPACATAQPGAAAAAADPALLIGGGLSQKSPVGDCL